MSARSFASGAFLLLLLLFHPAPSRAAETAPARYEFALDERTELTLEAYENDPKTFALELRQYGSLREGRVLLFMGDLKATGAGAFECSNDYDRTVRTVRVTGNPTAQEPLALTAKNVVLESGAEAKVAGTFRPLPAAARLARAKQRWENADALLNKVYSDVLAEVGKGGAPKLRELQRTRIAMRDQRAEYDARGEGKPQGQPAYWETMLDYTMSNIELLKIYTGRDARRGWTGRYRDIGGGTMELEETKKGLKFALSAVRKLSDANGEISGVAQIQGNRATYKEVLSKEDKAEGRVPAELTFTLSAGHLVKVEEKNTSYFGGMGVYFGGEYYKLDREKFISP